ncbi:MAG: fumarate hydratase, class II [Bacteroidetes bacterium]|nr:MAG: fumarate hydratase, class II [Bacteroidota bacterium]PIE88492.1 MAG: fumarate hydratase, class II [Bacteroidota bacterium]
MMSYREVQDTMGVMHVPEACYWGAQTQRSLENFKIGQEKMPLELLYALVLVKKASAMANHELGKLELEKRELIVEVCDEILAGRHDAHFPLRVWQSGSGTQTNMNVNEVIAFRGNVLANERGISVRLHPNDDVNSSQSTNDTFPSAMRIAVYTLITGKLIPALSLLEEELHRKALAFAAIVKTGRTHLMDATPLTLGQEVDTWASQLSHGLSRLRKIMASLLELPLGGTAVGNGLNTPEGYDGVVVRYVAALSGVPFLPAPSKFEAMASHDALVACHGALKGLAVSLMKIAHDVRLLGSGPRCGIGELRFPANEPGSSIMPGKVNPTQAEALSMVCVQVIGNDTAVSLAGANGHLQLNANAPVIILNMIHSINLLSDAADSFARKVVVGLEASQEKITEHLNNSLMLVTALNLHIGYEKAAQVAKLAFEKQLTLKQAAMQLGYLSEEAFDRIVDPRKMAGL